MQLKNFQENTLDVLDTYLKSLKRLRDEEQDEVHMHQQRGRDKKLKRFCQEAWLELQEQHLLPIFKNKKGEDHQPPYLNKIDGRGLPFPNVCLKVPTGGGKTYLGAAAVEYIISSYLPHKKTGLVLWIVPTEAIYQQTLKTFKNREHPYRQIFERTSGGRVKILEKNNTFSRLDLQQHLCVMLLMLQSTNRETKENLRVFKDSGRFISFFPPTESRQENQDLIHQVPNLDFYKQTNTLIIKHSLGNAIKIAQPIVVLDEGHRAYSEKARHTIANLNPAFVLELSATPNMKEHLSNVLVRVPGLQLKKEEMIKLPIHITTSDRSTWKKTICLAYEKLQQLHTAAQKNEQKSKQYIRPIVLIQVERTGKDQRDTKWVHAEDVREYLIQQLGVPEAAIRVKTSGRNELKDENLLNPLSQVQFIITKQALQEGWDCPFAYVLAILSQSGSRGALTQLIGRILRQPYAQSVPDVPQLNASYVFCHNRAVQDIVADIQKGLHMEGMDDVAGYIDASDAPHAHKKKVLRRKQFQELQIFLPRVLHRHHNTWRDLHYEADILQHIKFEKISYRLADKIDATGDDFLKLSHSQWDLKDTTGHLHLQNTNGTYKTPANKSNKKMPDQKAALLHNNDTSSKIMSDGTPRSFDVSPNDNITRHSLSDIKSHLLPMDYAHMVSRLSTVVPHSWQAARILDDVIQTLKTRGWSEHQIYLCRNELLHSIENDLQHQIEQLSQNIFEQKLKSGQIIFKIFKNPMDLNWSMAKELDFAISQDDKVLHRRDASPLQYTLFDLSYEKHYNSLEKKVALYLDEVDAVKWWHRMVAQNYQSYHLQGWQKKKIYPDFLACVRVGDGQVEKVSILESKGAHLEGNLDTQYKQKLFGILEKNLNLSHSSAPFDGLCDVGSVEANLETIEDSADEGTSKKAKLASKKESEMVFRILMQDWKTQIQQLAANKP